MAQESVLRISKEITDIQKGSDLSLAVAFREENVKKVTALIIGPPDTPYEFGFFEFEIKFGKEYPYKAPQVMALTTNYGKTRFNPNIYGDGKICLSILGTWRGEPGEQWSTAQGLESILISIQSLMSPNPWENEPGFEQIRRDSDKRDASLYAAKIRHETLRISVIERLEEWLNLQRIMSKDDGPVTFNFDPAEDTFIPFVDLCKRRFLWYYQSYLESIDREIKKHGDDVRDGLHFRRTQFESQGNGMIGTFVYSQLRERLKKINNAIGKETDDWETEGLHKADSPVALSFNNIFSRLSKDFTSKNDTLLDFELVGHNPFAWRLILFGKPMSNLEGGVFNIKIVFHANFPENQPRVKVETPLFHQRISPANGSLCYFPANANDVESHIRGIVAAIEDELPPYDPRTLVHPEASKLLWGDAEEKKTYSRKLRRSAQSSAECG